MGELFTNIEIFSSIKYTLGFLGFTAASPSSIFLLVAPGCCVRKPRQQTKQKQDSVKDHIYLGGHVRVIDGDDLGQMIHGDALH